MNQRQTLAGGLALAGAAIAATTAISRGITHRAAARFYRHTGPRTLAVHWGACYAGNPTVFNRSEANQTLHTASLDAVRAALPTSDLYPVRTAGDRAVIAITSLRYDQITSHGVHGQALMPYGEVMVAALVTRRPAPPMLPLLAGGLAGRSIGAFVLHLPVTHRAARDGGRMVWGFQKFIADMDFEDSGETMRCTLSEGGHDILRHTHQPSGRSSIASFTTVLYSSLEGELLAADIPMTGLARGRWGARAGRLELGDHQLTEELHELAINPEPFLGRRLSELRLAMNFGHAVGEARQYLGYIGEDRDFGRYTVRYGTEAAIDMYAPYGPMAKPTVAVEIGAAATTPPG